VTQAHTAGGGAGSHTLPNHVNGKRMVNMTLAKGHHAQTWRIARNSLIFSHDNSTPINYTLLFLTEEDDFSQDGLHRDVKQTFSALKKKKK
jgi:hypothetical protein